MHGLPSVVYAGEQAYPAQRSYGERVEVYNVTINYTAYPPIRSLLIHEASVDKEHDMDSKISLGWLFLASRQSGRGDQGSRSSTRNEGGGRFARQSSICG